MARPSKGSTGKLTEVDCNGPGITRRRAGKGFTYWDASGQERAKRITDREVIERIKALAIPPAWEDVWICSDPLGHIQATGRDARGRLQYRYHQQWQEARSAEKFERVVQFAGKLPGLREQVAKDLRRRGMPRERVLACAVRLLEVGCFRVGGAAYAEENGSFGLSTLRKEHVRVERRGKDRILWFDYDAKSGQQLQQAVVDERVLAVVTALKRRRAPADAELLAYKVPGAGNRARWVDVTAEDINEYLREHLGPDWTAKDFRTWVATVLAAVELAAAERPTSATARKKLIREVTADVAAHLGNTPAVARSAYIDPRVVERFEDGHTIASALDTTDIEDLERAVRRLLRRT
ncbi:MAG TPA: hypothetical protein VJ804_07230 [Acidimicrobiales bacterium]|nr:hypothetical protein [Acidimicrobiales bacterium]